MKKTNKHNLLFTTAFYASGIGNAASLKWPSGVLLFFFLLTVSSCQQKIASTSQTVAKQSEESTTAVVQAAGPAISAPDSQVVNGIHEPTGLIADEGYLLVRNNCSSCHSLDLVKNKRATREGWVSTIRWMQQTQGLWDLGANEKPILDYLAKNYAPKDAGRRKHLAEVEWYILKD